MKSIIVCVLLIVIMQLAIAEYQLVDVVNTESGHQLAAKLIPGTEGPYGMWVFLLLL